MIREPGGAATPERRASSFLERARLLQQMPNEGAVADVPIYFRLFIDDYERDTRDLSLTEHGAYLQLMLWYYGKAEPFEACDDGRLYKRVGAHSQSERRAVDVVLSRFFSFESGFYKHKRIEKELSHFRSRSAAAREAAKQKHNKINGSEHANAERTQSERSANQNQNHSIGLPSTSLISELGQKVRKRTAPARFVKPSIEEVQAYITEHHYTVDAARWYCHYESNGWKVGKNAMKSWQHAVQTWQSRENEK